MRIPLLAIAVLFCSASMYGQRSSDSERRHLYLTPSAFRGLPREIAADLKQRGCLIPQYGSTGKPNNVIRGEFARPGQIDLAVLCSVRGVSSILVYWKGEVQGSAGFAPLEDQECLQKDPGGRLLFLRAIQPVGRNFILEHYRAYGGPKPPAITHQGIDDAFLEKASVVWYFQGQDWLRLTGAD